MKGVSFFLALEARGWQVARVAEGGVEIRQFLMEAPDGLGAPPDPPLEVMAGLGYQGQAVCLGLPSQMTLAVQIDATGLPRRHRRTAMLYRLEEQLPIDAESITADFLPPVGGRTLAVAVQTAKAKAVVERLAQSGVEVVSICPTSLLALGDCSRGKPQPADFVIVVSDGQTDVFRMAEGRPITWLTSAQDAGALVREVEADLLAHPVEGSKPAARIQGPLDSQTTQALQDHAGVAVLDSSPEASTCAAARESRRLLAGEADGLPDLRRDALGLPSRWNRLARHLQAAAMLAVALLAVLSGTLVWRGQQYERAARELEAMQVRDYQRLYPNRQAPPNIRSRLRSEMSRLAGISGAGADLPAQPCSLVTLRSVMAGLPAEVRLRIVDLRVSPAELLIEGQSRTHGDAELIAQSLKRAGFAMDPPRTENLAKGGVSFSLAGKVGPATAVPARVPKQ